MKSKKRKNPDGAADLRRRGNDSLSKRNTDRRSCRFDRKSALEGGGESFGKSFACDKIKREPSRIFQKLSACSDQQPRRCRAAYNQHQRCGGARGEISRKAERMRRLRFGEIRLFLRRASVARGDGGQRRPQKCPFFVSYQPRRGHDRRGNLAVSDDF